MRNTLSNQKNNFLNRSVLAHSEVTSIRKIAPLGTITKFCSKPPQQGLQPDDLKYKEYRKLTQGLKERAGEILYTPNSKKQDFRVCHCGKLRIDKEQPVDVRYDAEKNRASFGNLQYCGSVWTCPDCSKKVSLAKKELVAQAVTPEPPS